MERTRTVRQHDSMLYDIKHQNNHRTKTHPCSNNSQNKNKNETTNNTSYSPFHPYRPTAGARAATASPGCTPRWLSRSLWRLGRGYGKYSPSYPCGTPRLFACPGTSPGPGATCRPARHVQIKYLYEVTLLRIYTSTYLSIYKYLRVLSATSSIRVRQEMTVVLQPTPSSMIPITIISTISTRSRKPINSKWFIQVEEEVVHTSGGGSGSY